MRDFNQIEKDWTSIGAAFAVPNEDLRDDVDPELLIIQILKEIPNNPRYAPIFVCWLERFGYLVDRTRLKELLKENENNLLLLFSIFSGEKSLSEAGEVMFNERLINIIKRAFDKRLLPLAKSKVLPVSLVLSLNKEFAGRAKTLSFK